MDERFLVLNQAELEKKLTQESSDLKEDLNPPEQEKIDETLYENPKPKLNIFTEPSSPPSEELPPHKITNDFIEKHGGIIAPREKRHTGRVSDSSQYRGESPRQLSDHDVLQQEPKDHGISDPSEWQQTFAPDEETIKESDRVRVEAAKNIIDSFYGEDEYGDVQIQREAVKTKLASAPKDLKYEIFTQWFKRDVSECLSCLDEFDNLPYYFQQDIAEYLATTSSNSFSNTYILSQALKVFNKITDPKLQELIVNNERINFSELAENRSKLPYLSDGQLLERAGHESGGYIIWYDWAAVIPYIDKFPTVDKNMAILGTLTQKTNSRPGVLIVHREKLNLSTRELLDLFYDHKNAYTLARNLKHVESEYHQEIAERCIAEGTTWAVLQNARDFRDIDTAEIIGKILETTSNSCVRKENGLTLIMRELDIVPQDWITQIPQEVIDEMVARDPAKVASQADKFTEKINLHELAEILLTKKDFKGLISSSEKLNLKRDAELAHRIIDNGGAEALISQIDRFAQLPREIYLRLVELHPEKTYPIVMNFENLLKEDIHSALLGLASNEPVLYETINQYIKKLKEKAQDAVTDEVCYLITGKETADPEVLQEVSSVFTELNTLGEEQRSIADVLNSFRDSDYRSPERLRVAGEYSEVSRKYHEKHNQFLNLIRAGTILLSHGHTLSIEELSEISKKNTYGLYEALGIFSLEEAKKIIQADVSVKTATEVKGTISKKGYEQTFEEILDMAEHDCSKLEEALSIWSLEDVKKLIIPVNYLDDAVKINNKLNRYNEALPPQIVHILIKAAQRINSSYDDEENIQDLAIEVFNKTINAGFTIEEIVKFPFLLSSLVPSTVSQNDKLSNRW